MLRRRSLLRFPIVFIFTLAVLLAISLEAHSFLDGYGLSDSREPILPRLQADFVAAVYFLVMSGYLFIFLLSYFSFTRKTTRRRMLLVNILGFITAYLLFSAVFADAFSMLEVMLLVAGLMSVVISDFVAESLERK
ncbi:hypothetical protein H0E84_05940 [Luteimonas sp. SJ-92]|uniref:Uncharacterized protein n=1 Tax=Luteimonas salinisoli TaxID=2752307 RepID=A0A853JB89_9GAMM|nr:hypothetical protein [Luteimonas salinisoli]NZA25919.1 hypothetical protein [Luteimonas salinisoli]